MQYDLLVSCPRDLVSLLENELQSLGMHIDRVSPQGVFGRGSLSDIYHISLWSRLAGRIYLLLFSANVTTENLVQQVCSQFPWQTVFLHTKLLQFHFMEKIHIFAALCMARS